jgi:hypothetical protein
MIRNDNAAPTPICLVVANVAASTLTRRIPAGGGTHFEVEEEGSRLIAAIGLYR